jgi:hypothetical protein
MKKALFFLIAFLFTSCVASVAGDPEDDARQALTATAADEGLELLLPFPPGSSRTLTQAYGTAGGTHVRHGQAHWDDAYALDFAGEGCDAWNTPVVAAEDGIVTTLPLGVARGSPEATPSTHTSNPAKSPTASASRVGRSSDAKVTAAT